MNRKEIKELKQEVRLKVNEQVIRRIDENVYSYVARTENRFNFLFKEACERKGIDFDALIVSASNRRRHFGRVKVGGSNRRGVF